MFMIWSEVAPIREVTELSKDAWFFFILFFVGNLFLEGQRLFQLSPETIFALSLSKNLYKD